MAEHAELVKLRDEGLIRHIGMSGHSRFEKMHRLISTGAFDMVLIEFGYFKRGYNTQHSNTQAEWRELCVAKAHELNMGIVAMKVLGANIYSHNAAKLVPDYDPALRAKLPAAAIRWVLNDPRISVLNLGISLPTDLAANLAIFTGDTTLTAEDRLLLADFAARAYESEYVQGLKIV
jgi:predicted aldo/keto reductase-like oxidoreductase